ncbi:MAG: UPF0182 family protein [Gemmatimonadales bacterium]
MVVREIGYQIVFARELVTQLVLFLGVGGLTMGVLYLNLRTAQRGLVPDRLVLRLGQSAPRVDLTAALRRLSLPVSLVIGLLAGFAATAAWDLVRSACFGSSRSRSSTSYSSRAARSQSRSKRDSTAGRLAGVKQGQDVGVLEPRGDLDLAEEPVVPEGDAMSGFRILMATGRSCFRSSARKTTARPPVPTVSEMRNRPASAEERRSASSSTRATLGLVG